MRRHEDPTNEKGRRLKELRMNLHEMYRAKETRDLTPEEMRKLDRLAQQIAKEQERD